jgi:ABC-2 type transport system ATP-binding protein
MSGGMKKRLTISCAAAHQPKILLLDEPSAALDLSCKAKIGTYLEEFKRQGGLILLATHDVQELPLCDRHYIMKAAVLHPYTYDGNVNALIGQL